MIQNSNFLFLGVSLGSRNKVPFKSAQKRGFLGWSAERKKRTYIQTYIHTYARTYVRTYVCTYVCIYIHTYIHTYVRMYVRTYVCMYVRTHVRLLRSPDHSRNPRFWALLKGTFCVLPEQTCPNKKSEVGPRKRVLCYTRRYRHTYIHTHVCVWWKYVMIVPGIIAFGRF